MTRAIVPVNCIYEIIVVLHLFIYLYLCMCMCSHMHAHVCMYVGMCLKNLHVELRRQL